MKQFSDRHIGPNLSEKNQMLATIPVKSLDTLIDETIPDDIRLSKEMDITDAMSEYEYLQHIKELGQKNKVWKSYIGMGFYPTITPPVIQRNILENPGWYTQYTPYQAEIAQGRLEALLNFQTMVCDLTGMEIANASLLDEATATGEAMQMLHRIKNKKHRKDPKNTFLVSDGVLPTSIDVLISRAEPLNIEVKVMPVSEFNFSEDVFGCLLQYPDFEGKAEDYREVVKAARANDIYIAVAADILSLALLKPPGEWGADVVVGNTQRLGVPVGYGGPHAAYFATREEFVRQVPGRIIGVSLDANEDMAYRMTLQTREQHIRRERATSNICTAQALLAIMAGMYAVYHGPEGIKDIATHIHQLAVNLSEQLKTLGYQQINKHFFDTLKIDLSNHSETSGLRIKRVAELDEVNFAYHKENEDIIYISLDETCLVNDVNRIVKIFAEAINVDAPVFSVKDLSSKTTIPPYLQRTSSYLSHSVFNTSHSETQMMRYIKKLENKDLSLTHSMIPLGSCTMKLNAASELLPITMPEFGQLHPFIPVNQAEGFQELISQLENDLCIITGFKGCSLQPNSGAQGEYAGLMVIRAYLHDKGETQRNVVLIPSSAHGTNPASAIMAGMKVVVVKCDERGNIMLEDLKKKAEDYQDSLAALMITYPSTHGVFETEIKEVCKTIHDFGGQVYMDGANMNAQVGLTSPGEIGADVCHLNLHKTFAIPHGGGGPGMGPICVAAHLVPYLPGHHFKENTSSKAIKAVSQAVWGSATILLISYAYIKMLGKTGLKKASCYAILNANYIKSRLEKEYDVLYVGDKGRVAHELILDMRHFKHSFDVDVEDIAKRLMDYGFHAPTVSFPVAGTLMIEPTESENKEELDRFCDALLAIREEIREIEEGKADKADNVLKNSPHTLKEVTADEWKHPYSRQKAAYPLPYLAERKFWPPAARVSNSYGDRNLMCVCPPVEAYEEV